MIFSEYFIFLWSQDAVGFSSKTAFLHFYIDVCTAGTKTSIFFTFSKCFFSDFDNQNWLCRGWLWTFDPWSVRSIVKGLKAVSTKEFEEHIINSPIFSRFGYSSSSIKLLPYFSSCFSFVIYINIVFKFFLTLINRNLTGNWRDQVFLWNALKN